MPAQVLIDRYWLKTYGLLPGNAKSVGEMPLADYQWFPIVDRAEAVASEREQAAARRRSKRGG